ncbi:hypothetical protein GCM10022251_19680 [Phytohabitans flavus]
MDRATVLRGQGQAYRTVLAHLDGDHDQAAEQFNADPHGALYGLLELIRAFGVRTCGDGLRAVVAELALGMDVDAIAEEVTGGEGAR